MRNVLFGLVAAVLITAASLISWSFVALIADSHSVENTCAPTEFVYIKHGAYEPIYDCQGVER